MEVSLTPIIKESFLQFGGAVLQSRALPDVRDLMKPSARQIFYCLYTDGFVHNKPFQKTLKAIGSCFRMYIHGDSSAEGVIMRAGQPFAMRYPLVEVEGSYGTLLASGSWSAPRYTSARLSPLANYLFSDIKKETISEWRDNYDNTEKYPMVLPSKGYFNIVNGSYGIGVGASTSIAPHNLKEVNTALIKLLWNPQISFEEIYCAPDFPTGAMILNGEEVKEAYKKGEGFACKIRAIVEWEEKERCLIVKQIPYMLYTETICKQLEEIINGEDNPGIERFNDLTGAAPLIKIYLDKKASRKKVINYLYKKTSLQSYYSNNFTILENGRYPKLYTWKQLLQAHLDHEKEVYTRGFQYDLKKISSRLHIIDGLIKAYDMIDEVVQTIKSSSTTSSASFALQKLLEIDEVQAKAILDLKLSRLSKLDITKLKNEKEELEKEKSRIEAILSDEILLKKEIEKGLREVAEKFGDERRTKILNVEKEEDEPIEKKTLIVNLTNKNNIFVEESSSLYTVRRGSVGSKFKLDKGEFVTSCQTIQTTDNLLLFTNSGYYYSCAGSTIPLEKKSAIESFLPIKDDEHISFISPITDGQYILFATKKGYLKKSDLSEYKTNRSIGIKAISLEEDDQIVSISLTHNEPVGILSAAGRFIMCETSDIRPIGRIARGIKGINLDDGDYVVAVKQIPQKTKTIAFISEIGLIKQTDKKEFSVTGKNTKGTKVWKDKSKMADFLPLIDEQNILICNERAQLKIAIDEIPLLGKSCLGVKSSKIKDGQRIVGIIRT